jgi:YbbR domain-containing protein
MRKLLTRNLGWKLLSLAIAYALWIAIAREPELETSISVPIEFKNLPRDIDISSDVPDRVHIEIRGPSTRLTHDYLSSVAVVLDLSDTQPGERTFTIHDWNASLPFGVAFDRAVPSQITLRFAHLSSRDVSIVPRYLKPPPQGYRVASFEFKPAMVRIRGPEDHVTRTEAVTTDPIDLSGVVKRAKIPVHINVGDPQIRLEMPRAVTTFTVVVERAR